MGANRKRAEEKHEEVRKSAPAWRRRLVEEPLTTLASGSSESSAPPAPLPAYIGFRLGELHYAAPLENVVEVDRPGRAVPAPNAPELVIGVTNLRGEILCLVDLRRLLGLPPDDGGDQERLIRVRGGSRGLEAAILVDSAYRLDAEARLSDQDSTDSRTPRLLNINQLLDSSPLVELCEAPDA